MKTKLNRQLAGAALVATFVLVGAVAAEGPPTVDIHTEYLMTLEAPLDAAQNFGQRVVVNVPAGGTVRGPKIKGTVVPPSGDWIYPMQNGSSRVDVRLTIKTDDNAMILMEYGGIIAWTKELRERYVKGEVITAADLSGLVAPRFTTASTAYDWLNNVQAVGKVVSIQRGAKIVYDVFVIR